MTCMGSIMPEYNGIRSIKKGWEVGKWQLPLKRGLMGRSPFDSTILQLFPPIKPDSLLFPTNC